MSKRFLHIIRPYGTEHAGDQQVCLETETDLAQTLFEEAIANGAMAYKEVDGKQVATRKFDPDAARTTIRPPMAGG